MCLPTLAALVCSSAQVAGSGNVLGGFIAPAWLAEESDGWIEDPTLRSFTFSLVNAHSRPVKLKLAAPAYAAHQSVGYVQLCHDSIVLMRGEPLNAGPNGENGTAGRFVQLDDRYERKCGLTNPTFDLGKGFMSGMPGGKFACAEVEVFAMQQQQEEQQEEPREEQQ